MMTDQKRTMKHLTRNEFATPKVVDRTAFQAELDALRLREKAHTKESDAIAAARRRLPMLEARHDRYREAPRLIARAYGIENQLC